MQLQKRGLKLSPLLAKFSRRGKDQGSKIMRRLIKHNQRNNVYAQYIEKNPTIRISRVVTLETTKNNGDLNKK